MNSKEGLQSQLSNMFDQQMTTISSTTYPFFEEESDTTPTTIPLPNNTLLIPPSSSFPSPRPTLASTRERRNIRPPTRYGHIAVLASPPPISIPKTYASAIQSDECTQWQNAMSEEVAALRANNTWELVQAPPGAHILPGKWVYVVKYDEKGDVDRFKARWVVQGNRQVDGVDYTETFAPTSHLPSLRILISLVAAYNWYASTLDISTAFLNGNLTEEIYVKQPNGFQTDPHFVCRLKKSLYGLRQAPRVWFEHLSAWMHDANFFSSPAEPCLYTGTASSGTRVYILIHVDDFLITASTKEAVVEIESKLESSFKLKKGGALNWYLNFQFIRHDNVILMSQHTYAMNILSEFNMDNCNSVPTPMVPGFDLPTTEPLCDQQKYQKAIGMLLYLARGTRPDIMTAVAILSKYTTKPSTYHWQGILHLLKYIKGTSQYVLQLGGTDFEVYADADWATDTTDRKSRSGFVVKMGQGVVSWASKKQTTVALSSSEAEYYALSEAVKETLWIQSLFHSLQLSFTIPTIIHEDNRGAQLIAENPMVTPRAKHIDLRYHFLRHHIHQNLIQLNPTPTSKMLADCTIGDYLKEIQRAIPSPINTHTFSYRVFDERRLIITSNRFRIRQNRIRRHKKFLWNASIHGSGNHVEIPIHS
ncbi:DNA-directed DNA polymerase [Synchytrium endobioticum]|uniref:DNA-directed DNA polymerase n=1 Tax=Synchytrium endobioticum TaxID=286115 RepID=A0A507DFC4_9FUNG|nr:hypothetical protein SeMB42_g02422 [Synchytrium endobioticum]TPX49947.1 DNA-directed DNA polymerase [Synchytrium endobioticum]